MKKPTKVSNIATPAKAGDQFARTTFPRIFTNTTSIVGEVVRAARGRADRGKWHTYFSLNRFSKIVKELFSFLKPYFSYEYYITAK
jgi:hypothetical protein